MIFFQKQSKIERTLTNNFITKKKKSHKISNRKIDRPIKNFILETQNLQGRKNTKMVITQKEKEI